MCFPVLQKAFMHPVVNSRLVFLPDACSGELYPTFLRTLHKFPFKQNTCQGPWAGMTRARAEDAEKTTLTAPSYSPAPTSSMSRAKRAPHQVASQSWRDFPPTSSSTASPSCHPQRKAEETASVPWKRPGRWEQVLLLTKRKWWKRWWLTEM